MFFYSVAEVVRNPGGVKSCSTMVGPICTSMAFMFITKSLVFQASRLIYVPDTDLVQIPNLCSMKRLTRPAIKYFYAKSVLISSSVKKNGLLWIWICLFSTVVTEPKPWIMIYVKVKGQIDNCMAPIKYCKMLCKMFADSSRCKLCTSQEQEIEEKCLKSLFDNEFFWN